MASMPAAAAARATANASRFSSAAPVACARWRPSVAERVTAIGQATPSNGTGLFAGAAGGERGAERRRRRGSCCDRFGQVTVAAQRRRRGEGQLARDRDSADGRRGAAARERARRADEDDARRARRSDGRGRAQGGVDRADADRRQREAFPIERARQPAQVRNLRFPRGQHQRRRHLRTRYVSEARVAVKGWSFFVWVAARPRFARERLRRGRWDQIVDPDRDRRVRQPGRVRVSEADHLGRADRAVQ